MGNNTAENRIVNDFRNGIHNLLLFAAKGPWLLAMGMQAAPSALRENTRRLFSPLLYCVQFFCTLRM